MNDLPDTAADARRELPITGYLDRWSARPGELLEVKISTANGTPCSAKLLRLISADPNPAGPGVKTEDLSSLFSTHFSGQHQSIALGSYGVAATPGMSTGGVRTWTALCMPSRLAGDHALIWHGDPGHNLTLGLCNAGVFASVVDEGLEQRVESPFSLRLGNWYRVWVTIDTDRGVARVGIRDLSTGCTKAKTADLGRIAFAGDAMLLVGAAGAECPSHHFDGKVEDVAVLEAGPDQADELGQDLPAASTVLLRYDFSQRIDTDVMVDIGPASRHGRFLNLPQRAVTGAAWSGAEHCWRHAPGDYAAVKFNSDDLHDCNWQTTFGFRVPDGLKSGCYLLHLECESGQDWIPFYVLAPKGKPSAAVAFLAPTMTYLAYANHARGNCDEAMKRRMEQWCAYPYNADDYPVYGRSTYNRHADGSGVTLSSRLRPILTMRPGYLTFDDARGSGLRHFPADSHLLGWLEAKGIAYDVITDDDLDSEGVDAASPYPVVLTGSHPEYYTRRMLDALDSYIAGGGNLAYLGGNGFYWKIARTSERPHVMEIRRTEGGIRNWATDSGEYYHQLDGDLGGMWRRSRRDPQKLVGIGFSAVGAFDSTYYVRLPDSHREEVRWLFDGIGDERLGDYGLSGGGAAGFEYDRADFSLGTPVDAFVVATSQNPPESFVVVLEELLSHVFTATGAPPDTLRRADIVYFRRPGGGEVFSVGSITYLGSLWKDGAYGGAISRMLENVVTRFSIGRTGTPKHISDKDTKK